MRYAAFAFLALACFPHRTFADESDVERGDRVRVSTLTLDKKSGVVESAAPGVLSIRLDGELGSISIPVAELKSIEISHGPRTRCAAAWSKGKWGALIGGISGISLGFQHEEVGEEGLSFGEAALLGAWSGGLIGGLIGAAIGAGNPGEVWENVSLSPAIHFGSGGKSGFSLRVNVAF